MENDPQGPSPTERDNHVVIDPVDLSHGDLLKSFVFEHLDPVRPSTEMGADIYTKALELVLDLNNLLILEYICHNNIINGALLY